LIFSIQRKLTRNPSLKKTTNLECNPPLQNKSPA
jgi:hypothetical protein